DLTQYLLAVDTNNKQVANLYSCLHPSVLNAIQHVVTVAHKHNKTVSVCGEMAGDPASALALIGMGVDSLSMSAGSLLRVKLVLRFFTQKQAKKLLDEALLMENASRIRMLFSNAIDRAGLNLYIKQ
ncbi:MAG: phosphoenolpyruvate-protein phosphotransferase PtsP, partial [Gammaproteobacteria bacterium]|nr:phosphoenolpyruvate-protein phosphotransferase PtsP [Gammaproteobacteria bacterium]